jgi:hypothetical protein|tara:strand:- start:1280 stop:1573 length:294 start_codon:yes stop_codon:yes gene_type:complete
MEKSKIDRFIDAFRVAMYSEFEVNEDGVVPANNIGGGKIAGTQPAGDDPPVKLDGRRKYVKKYMDQLMKNRKKREDKKAMRKVMDFNPYFSPNGKRS